MYYEINVSKNGKHYFATAERSLRLRQEALELYAHFEKLFPKTEGYEISLTHWETFGERIDIKKESK